MKNCAYLLCLLAMACGGSREEPLALGLTKYVDPLIGTDGHGHVFPGATVPFGSVQLSPDNGTQGWDWCAGYHYSDSTIVGFSHTHLSGTGIGDLCDLLVMPVAHGIDLTVPIDSRGQAVYASTFSHANERATAGYYAVTLDNGIQVELTTSQYVGLHKYSYPADALRNVVIDLGYHINWDRPDSTRLTQKSENLFVGERHSTGWAKTQRLYFACTFSEVPSQMQLYDSTQVISGMDAMGQGIKALWQFEAGSSPLLMKVAISSASIEGAIAALQEIPDWDFRKTHQRAIRAWNAHLGTIQVQHNDDARLRTFYTALYHTALAPVIYDDILDQYHAAASGVMSAQDYHRYDIFSLWDTFRASHPLLTITHPELVTDFIKSLLAHYDEHGLLPVWSLLGNETNTMTGYHAMPVILDAYLKGHRDFNVEKAFEAMERSAMQDIRHSDHYRKYGFIPYDLGGESVTKTLEYAYDDWCIAQMALLLGKKDRYDYYLERSKNYRHLFDSSSGFMRAKMSDGTWKTPFDPRRSDHNFAVSEYTEGNAWQHAWFVPHDVRGLIDLHGGNEPFIKKLDSLFAVESDITGENASPDISGLIGQYAHGNEPSHHIPYLYNYVGVPWKGQAEISNIMKTLYDDTPSGLCGNEDCGQLSAWYVFSGMGFYPVNPAEGVYVIGSPQFQKTVIDVGDGKVFVIRATYLTDENQYIQAATLNDIPLTRSFLYHFEMVEGGELRLEMGPNPNYLHWSDAEAYPPSMSDPE